MNYGHKIAELRKMKGWSQDELAFKLNVTAVTVKQWENDEIQPEMDELVDIANAFGVSLSDLSKPTSAPVPSTAQNDYTITASTTFNNKLYARLALVSIARPLVLWMIISAVCFYFLANILQSGYHLGYIAIPLAGIAVVSAILIRVVVIVVKRDRKDKREKPNKTVHYAFHRDYADVDVLTDNENRHFVLTYNQMKVTNYLKDKRYLYIVADKKLYIIDRSTCRETESQIVDKFFPKRFFVELNPKIDMMLKAMFALSILSIFFALFAIAAATGDSTTEALSLENMWIMYTFIPIPAVSAILGIVFRRKNYRCTKNIVAGVIVTFILSIFGSFPQLMTQTITSDYSYVTDLSDETGIYLPEEGSVVVYYDYPADGEVYASIKMSDDAEKVFMQTIMTNSYWKNSTNFIPSNLMPDLAFVETKDYDYFIVYNKRTKSYNKFSAGTTVLLAYDEETNTIKVYEYLLVES